LLVQLEETVGTCDHARLGLHGYWLNGQLFCRSLGSQRSLLLRIHIYNYN
jgi:hypothetical protein